MAEQNNYPLLMQIESPEDMRKLDKEQLSNLAAEMRQYLIDSLDVCGGHFGANLGSIEITIALHYLFNTPNDKIIWDVGHQAYPHKMLTGRRDQLSTIKQPNGLAPFPKRDESEYDSFGTGHSSTSISAAVGMAIAAEKQGRAQKTIAVIGDGGMTGGMAFEALNHVGAEETDLLVILNDNDMSISENVGALTQYFAKLTSGPTYANLRETSKRFLSKMPHVKKFAKLTESQLKGLVNTQPGNIFESLGFHYYGPIDGHDVNALLRSLAALKDNKSPRILHIITTKGKGYSPAEEDPIKYHAVSAGFHNKTSTNVNAAAKTYSDVFGDWLCDMANADKKLMAITPAMREGSGMVRFSREHPEQYFDVAIAEQHSVTFAAGLACEGLKPVVAIYSTFLQRGFDQVVHDVCLQNLDVTFALDRAGLVGSDGPTHSGRFDLSYLRCLPNMVIAAPADGQDCRDLLYSTYLHTGPAAVRYPRGSAINAPAECSDMTLIPIGKAEIKRQGKNIAILAFGSMVKPALEAGEQLNATVVNMRFVKPLDKSLIKELALTHNHFITIEENTIQGGAGSAVSEFLAQEQIIMPIYHLGLPDRFIDHGKPAQMLADVGLDAAGILSTIETKINGAEKITS